MSTLTSGLGLGLLSFKGLRGATNDGWLTYQHVFGVASRTLELVILHCWRRQAAGTRSSEGEPRAQASE